MKEKTMNIVASILEKNKKARNSDTILILNYMLEYTQIRHADDNVRDEICNALMQMPMFESITRCRRKLQSQGFYQASSETQKERKKMEIKYRKDFFNIK